MWERNWLINNLILQVIIVSLVAYALGSISSAIILCKLIYKKDIRELGSGNPGANNVQRVFGWKPGLSVFVFDIFKGWAAVKLITFTTIPEGSELYSLIQILLILCVFLGHVFPVFFEFKGGKGVAALTGAMVAIHPYAALLSFTVFLIILMITHYTSLSVIITAISYPLFMNLLFGNLFDDDMTVTVRIFSILVAVLLPMTHLSNIKRLLSGKEEKFRLKKGV